MKIKKFLLVTASVLVLGNSMTAFAAPEIMADGTLFDAEYYAQANPDVATVYGTDKNALFQHYTMFGKSEGRTACADATPQMPSDKSYQADWDLDGIASSYEFAVGVDDEESYREQPVIIVSAEAVQADLDSIIEMERRDILKKQLSSPYYYYQ